MSLREVIAAVSDPASVMERVLAEALSLIPAASGAAVQLGTDAGDLSCVAAAGQLSDAVGARVPVHGSMTGRCLLEGSLRHCGDTADDPDVDRDLCTALSIVSVICVPLRRHTGAPIGVFVVTSDRPDVFGDADRSALDRLTDFISIVIGAALDLESVTEQLLAPRGSRFAAGTLGILLSEDVEGSSARARAGEFIANVMHPGAVLNAITRERVERVLAGQGLEILLQPIIALDTGQVVDAEALARFDGPPRQDPDRWFADATAVGLGDELELVAVERALALLPLLPSQVGIAVNVGPETLSSNALFDRLDASTPRRVTVELTEHVGIGACSKLQRARQTLRELGARVAIDDTGTGFASLALVLKMEPDVIKLDRELTGGIHFDPVRRALARSLVSFAGETGAQVVAEGIETAAELRVLADLGVAYGQGFYLARPGRVEDVCGLVGLPDGLAALG